MKAAAWLPAWGPRADNQGGTAVLLEWVRDGTFPLAKMVTNRYSLDQAEQARIALEEGQVLGRAIIEI
jgi:Zn-dependent alcohol dehydrogenase